VHTLKTVKTHRPDVAVIVRTPPALMERVARQLSAAGVHASFASITVPARTTVTGLHAFGDEPIAEVKPASALRWLQTRGALRSQARAMHPRRHHFYFLQPASGFSPGELVLARTAGASPVAGSVRISATSPLPQRPLRAGDVLVVTLDGSDASVRAVAATLSAALSPRGLSAVPLSTLA
jgi:hypothetical protein